MMVSFLEASPGDLLDHPLQHLVEGKEGVMRV